MLEHLTHDAVMGHLPSTGLTDCNLSLTKLALLLGFVVLVLGGVLAGRRQRLFTEGGWVEWPAAWIN